MLVWYGNIFLDLERNGKNMADVEALLCLQSKETMARPEIGLKRSHDYQGYGLKTFWYLFAEINNFLIDEKALLLLKSIKSMNRLKIGLKGFHTYLGYDLETFLMCIHWETKHCIWWLNSFLAWS